MELFIRRTDGARIPATGIGERQTVEPAPCSWAPGTKLEQSKCWASRQCQYAKTDGALGAASEVLAKCRSKGAEEESAETYGSTGSERGGQRGRQGMEAPKKNKWEKQTSGVLVVVVPEKVAANRGWVKLGSE